MVELVKKFLETAVDKLKEQTFIVILLLAAIYYLNTSTSKRVDYLEKQISECRREYQDLMKMYYFSHDYVPGEAVPKHEDK